MNAYLISQLPLISGIFALPILAPALVRGKDLISAIISILSVAGTIVLMCLLPASSKYYGGAILVTALGKSVAGIALTFIILAFVLTYGYLQRIHVMEVEWRLTVLFISLGIYNLSFAEDLATIFIAFELLSIPSYALVGFSRRDGRSNEAGMKYLVLGIIGSAFLLIGITFVYGASGQIFISGIKEDLMAGLAIARTSPSGQLEIDLYRIALGAFIASLFFKTAVAPFHGWLLDVYKGSSYAALSIIGVAAKVAGFGLLFKLLHGPFEPLRETWTSILGLAAIASFVFGGFQGLYQRNVKRILASSSVLNAGFILLSMLGDGRQFTFYLAAYSAATLGVIAYLMSSGTAHADVDVVEDLHGTSRKHPAVALGFTVVLCSSAGVPLTAGFIAKFGVIYSMLQGPEKLPGLAAVAGALCSVLAFYYYFKIIRAIWFESEIVTQVREQKRAYLIVCVLLVCALLAGGIYPPALTWI
ncbi:MAG TPA: NADH-quinone oxidoreductase subunit N [Leptospiraceae bacterium]|nr:NADH-quinone oxidoreductase subunit N [Leptospiraceae bacterium]